MATSFYAKRQCELCKVEQIQQNGSKFKQALEWVSLGRVVPTHGGVQVASGKS